MTWVWLWVRGVVSSLRRVPGDPPSFEPVEKAIREWGA